VDNFFAAAQPSASQPAPAAQSALARRTSLDDLPDLEHVEFHASSPASAHAIQQQYQQQQYQQQQQQQQFLAQPASLDDNFFMTDASPPPGQQPQLLHQQQQMQTKQIPLAAGEMDVASFFQDEAAPAAAPPPPLPPPPPPPPPPPAISQAITAPAAHAASSPAPPLFAAAQPTPALAPSYGAASSLAAPLFTRLPQGLSLLRWLSAGARLVHFLAQPVRSALLRDIAETILDNSPTGLLHSLGAADAREFGSMVDEHTVRSSVRQTRHSCVRSRARLFLSHSSLSQRSRLAAEPLEFLALLRGDKYLKRVEERFMNGACVSCSLAWTSCVAGANLPVHCVRRAPWRASCSLPSVSSTRPSKPRLSSSS
jgi:hypothetical protein